jgi:O-antigen/teichoic acid export membrane protein
MTQHRERNSILKNASFLFASQIGGRVLAFVLTIILPKYLIGGFDDLGKYFFAAWLTSLLSGVTELGLHTPLIRDLASDKSKSSLLISNAFVIRIILSVITLLILILIVTLKYPDDIGKMIYIIGVSEIINTIAQLFRCMFRAYENMGFEALGVIVERLVVFLIGIWVVIMGYGIVTFSIVVLIASIVNLTLTSLIMVFKFSRIDLRLLKLRTSIELLKQSLPYAIGGILYMAYFRVDGVLLKSLLGSEGNVAMGWYGTGYSFVNAFTIIPGAFMGAILPVMSRTFASSKSLELDYLYTRSLKLMLMIGLPIAIGTTFLADEIVGILYPLSQFALRDQEALSIILKVLIWSGMLLFMNFIITTLYRATDARKAYTIITALSLCVNITSNIMLIPRYSYLGASISMVISEMVFFICGAIHVQIYICKIRDFRFIIKIISASAILILLLLAFQNIILVNHYIHLAVTFIISVVVYSAIMLLTHTVTKEDIAMIREQNR